MGVTTAEPARQTLRPVRQLTERNPISGDALDPPRGPIPPSANSRKIRRTNGGNGSDCCLYPRDVVLRRWRGHLVAPGRGVAGVFEYCVIFEVIWAFFLLAVIASFLIDADPAWKLGAAGIVLVGQHVVWVVENRYGLTGWAEELAVVTIELSVAGVALLAYVVRRVGGGLLVMLGGTTILGAWAVNAWSTLVQAHTGEYVQLLGDTYWIMDSVGIALLMTSYGLHRRRAASMTRNEVHPGWDSWTAAGPQPVDDPAPADGYTVPRGTSPR